MLKSVYSRMLFSFKNAFGLDSEPKDGYNICVVKQNCARHSKTLNCQESIWPLLFSDFVRSHAAIEDIFKILVLKNGKPVIGKLPPVWVNEVGYVYSSDVGLEKVVTRPEAGTSKLKMDQWTNVVRSPMNRVRTLGASVNARITTTQ